MPAGSGLMVKPETHQQLKEFREKYIDKGFKFPDLEIHNNEYEEMELNLSFGGSERHR
jgi:hypothetical protein